MTDVAARAIPDDLSELTDDELQALLDELEAEFDKRHEEGSRDIAEMTQLADAVVAIRGEQQRRVEEAAEVDARIDSLVEMVHPASNEDDESGVGDDDEEDDEEETATPSEPTVDALNEDKETLEVDEVITAAGERVVRPSLAATQARAPRPKVPARVESPVTITAAADIPGVPVGAKLDEKRLLRAMHDKVRPLANHSPYIPVAQIDLGIPEELTLNNSPEHNLEVFNRAIGNVTDTEALVAAGGWCAPSMPVFTFFQVDDVGSLLSLPTMGMTRGGVQVPVFDQLDFTNAFWIWTEADDEAALTDPPPRTKTCIRIPCPTWQECRPAAYGLCVTAGNMQSRAWPETQTDFLRQMMNAYLRWISAQQLGVITNAAVDVAYTGENSDAAGDLLSALELAAAQYRNAYMAGAGRSVVVLLPEWTQAILRANLAKRAGVDLLGVSDAQINSWLAMGGIAPQFLSEYQQLRAFGSATPITTWPAAIRFTMFFAGSYVVVDGGTLDLGVVRDSVLNATNDYTAAWMERFFCMLNLGPAPEEWTVDLTVDGVTACCAAAAP